MRWIKPAVILAAGRVRRASTGICASSHGSCFQGLKQLKKATPVLPSENQASPKAAEHQIWVENVHLLSFLLEEGEGAESLGQRACTHARAHTHTRVHMHPELCTNTHKCYEIFTFPKVITNILEGKKLCDDCSCPQPLPRSRNCQQQ